MAGQQAGAAQGGEELLKELVGDVTALGQLFDRHRSLPRAGQLGERNDRVAGLGGDRDHAFLSTAPSGPGWARIVDGAPATDGAQRKQSRSEAVLSERPHCLVIDDHPLVRLGVRGVLEDRLRSP